MKLLRVLALLGVGNDQPLGLLELKLQQPLLAKQVHTTDGGWRPAPAVPAASPAPPSPPL